MSTHTSIRRTPALPWRGRLTNLAGAARRLVRKEPYLEVESVLDFAREDTGLEDFGEKFEPEVLELLLEAAKATDLTFIGRRSVYSTVGTALAVRLLYIEVRKRHPEIFARPMPAPLIVTGPPRSGTTVLQNLLALHPGFDAIPNWELIRPISPQLRGSSRADRRQEMAEEWDTKADQYVRKGDHIHFRRANTPGECILLMLPTLRSYAFIGLAPVYSFMDELMRCDGHAQYSEYAELLKILQHARPGRPMVLKAPAHAPYVDLIQEYVPGAMIVATHRDLVTTTTSLLSLYQAGYSQCVASYDVRAHSEKMLDIVESGTMKYIAARDRNPEAIHDVFYDELMVDPVGVVRGIYDGFGLPWPENHEDRITAYLAANPKGKHGRHRYQPTDFHTSEAEIRERLAGPNERLFRRSSGS